MVEIKKLDELKAKIDETKVKLETIANKDKEKIEEAISEVKGNINATKENYEIWSKDKESQIFSESLKMKMTVAAKFDELKETIENKKYEHTKQKQRAKADKALERAEHAASFAIWSIEEAMLAYLEAAAAEADYIAEYGDIDKENTEK